MGGHQVGFTNDKPLYVVIGTQERFCYNWELLWRLGAWEIIAREERKRGNWTQRT
jgi:hypothetical protein